MRGLYLRATRTYCQALKPRFQFLCRHKQFVNPIDRGNIARLVSKAGQQLPSSTEANDTFTQSYADLA